LAQVRSGSGADTRPLFTMARSDIWLLGIACAWHAQGVQARDGDGQEYFPLSGGVSNGVRVTVKAASLSTSAGATQLDFLTPDRTVAFRWDMDTAAQSINRSSDISATSETWGQSSVDANGALSFEFYKTSESWQVSIATGGAAAVRFPWFDFALQSTDLMTHLSVYDGFVDVEVIQDRPLCDTVCHASECASTCGTDEAPETCFSTTSSMDCSSEQVTGHLTDADRVCCDSLERRIVIEPVPVSEWVALADVALLTRACAAFASSASCTDYTGLKGQVQSCDNVAKTCEVWVPTAQAAESTGPATPPADAILTLPAYGLVSKSDMQMRSIIVPDPTYRMLWDDGWTAGTFQVDYHTGLVFSATAQTAVDYTIDRGWFMSMVRYNPGYWYGSRWFQYSATIVDDLSRPGKSDISIFLTDEPILPRPVCGLSYYPDTYLPIPQMAGQTWHDYKGNNCSAYEERDYCTRHAEPTQAWCDDIFFPNFDATTTCVPGNTDMITYGCELNAQTNFQCFDQDGIRVESNAVYECCECGGGDSTGPEGWVEPNKKTLFQ